MWNRIRPDDIPGPVVELCRTLARSGYRGWVVGGSLRDLLRGRGAADWDLATDATPAQVQALFSRVIPTGIQHGTVTVRHRGKSYEVTTLRGEGAYSDGRRPDRVEFVTEIDQDLARRDFTINALAYDPVAGELVDPFGGLADLERGLIRAVGEPAQRFAEDGLRVLRAARFAATLEFAIEAETEAAIRPTLATFRKVSAERVRDEWLRALGARQPSRAFAVMRRTGILEVTIPELAALDEGRFERALIAVDHSRNDPCSRIAALFWSLRGELTRVADWLVRYRFTNQERARVVRMLEHAAPPGTAAWSDAEVRRYAQRVGRAFLPEVTELGVEAVRAYEGRESEAEHAAAKLRGRVERLVGADTPLTPGELALDGRELMEALALAPGPRVGQLLTGLLDRVLEDPSLNTRERLLDEARAIARAE